MTENPLISIIMPCYNVQATVGLTIKSILQQSYSNWELITIDDGSSDETCPIIRNLNDPRIRLLSDGNNRGCPTRLNEGIAAATGSYIARMDADDVMFPQRLEKQLCLLQENPEVDLVGSGIISIDVHNCVKAQRTPPPRITDPYRILKGEVLYHPTVMGKRDWFLAHPYDPAYIHSDDYALWCSAASDLCIANIQEPLLFYREHQLFTYAKYRGRKTYTNRAIKTYAPALVGRGKTLLLLLRRAAKNSIYTTLYLSGLWRLAHGLANKGLSDKERDEYHQLLTSIKEFNC